jgi:Tol biopolymer transport system component
MKPIFVTLILITVLFTVTTYPLKSQTPEQLYQRGLTKEEGEGALQDAISLYNQVADNSSASISLRAKALMHIGMCYEKLGAKEAVKAYQRLLANFPTQKNEVAYARERLTRLTPIAEKVSDTPLTPKFTKIEIPTKPGNGVLSPDGKNLVYVSEKSLWILPVHGKTNADIAGEPVKLTEPMGVWDLANMGIVWSSNGKWIAYQATRTGEDKRKIEEIYVISAAGGKPVKVNLDLRRNLVGYDYRISLSPDGKILAFVNRDENKKSAIYTISVDGGTQTKLTGSGTREPAFSPDGKLIAYITINPQNELGNEIWVIPSTGGNPVLVSNNAGVVKSPVWSPDGSMIAFLARKYKKGWNNASNELWIVPVSKNGGLTDLAAKISLDYSTSSMLSGWSQDNKIGFWLDTPYKNVVYTVQATGGQAMQVTPKNSWIPGWSPDGKYLFFEGTNTDDWAGIEAIPVDGGDVSKIPVISEYAVQPGMPTGGISVSPDGKKIVFAGYYYNISDTLTQKKLEGSHIMTIPVSGGKPFQLTSNPPMGDGFPTWSPDGKTIAFMRVGKINANNTSAISFDIYTIPADGGTPKKITSSSDRVGKGRINWSPDGKWIGFFSDDKAIKVISPEGGNSKIVLNDVEPDIIDGLSFSPDGNKIAFSNKNKIFTIDLSGENKTEVKTGLDEIHTMPAWSPDGKKIAFSANNIEETDLWLMEDFLPLEKLAQKNETKDLVVRKVLSDAPSEPVGTLSPDGRYISFVDWDSGANISIMDLKTKDKRCLTNFKEPYEEGYYSSWSPDGKNIAYFWWDSTRYNLSIVDVIESKSRDLLKSEKVDWVELGNWSSDGKYIVATLTLRGENKSQIVRISTTDGSIQILKTFNKSYLGGKPYISPDSRYVAYDLPDDKASGNSDIYVFSIKDGSENALFKHPALDYILGWTPDGKSILFATDRKGTVDAMTIKVEEGKSIGEPKSVKQNIGQIVPMGFARNGTFYYGQWPNENNIYTAEIDFENGKILTQPTIAIRRFESKNRAPSYSNDGKYLAYISDRGLFRKGNSGNLICIHDLKTGEESEIMPDATMTKPIRSYLQWSPDNRSIALMCNNQEGYTRIYIYDFQTKKFTPLVAGSEDHLHDTNYAYPLWSKDGKFLYYLQISKTSKSTRFMVWNIAAGTEKELYRYSSDDLYDRIFTLSLSPDGKWLSAINIGGNKVVRLISTSDGKTHDLYTCKTIGTTEYDQVWSKDGKYIIISYPKQLENGEHEWNLMRLPFEGGENLSIKTKMLGMFNPTLHPDGRTLSFESTGYSKPENSIWAMENFLPKE